MKRSCVPLDSLIPLITFLNLCLAGLIELDVNKPFLCCSN